MMYREEGVFSQTVLGVYSFECPFHHWQWLCTLHLPLSGSGISPAFHIPSCRCCWDAWDCHFYHHCLCSFSITTMSAWLASTCSSVWISKSHRILALLFSAWVCWLWSWWLYTWLLPQKRCRLFYCSSKYIQTSVCCWECWTNLHTRGLHWCSQS